MAEENNIPFMFRGSTRVYRVLGVQGETVYGLNMQMTTSGSDKTTVLTFAFGCLGGLPEGSPFKSRGETKFAVAFTPNPKGPVAVADGLWLNKIELKVGQKLSGFASAAYLAKHLEDMKSWIDGILESAGVMPTYNDVTEIFNFFFGEQGKDDSVYFPLEFKPLGDYDKKSIEPIDYGKYGKEPKGTAAPEGGGMAPSTPLADQANPAADNPHAKPNHWDSIGGVGPHEEFKDPLAPDDQEDAA